MLPLDHTAIMKHLSQDTRSAIDALTITPCVDSTNNQLLKTPNAYGHVCLAEQQTAGRGRHGKTWHSPAGHNIYLSLLWPTAAIQKEKLACLSLLCGLALHRALTPLTTSTLALKWPNDLYLDQKKLAGILIDRTPTSVIIGMGVNIHRSQESDPNWAYLSDIIKDADYQLFSAKESESCKTFSFEARLDKKVSEQRSVYSYMSRGANFLCSRLSKNERLSVKREDLTDRNAIVAAILTALIDLLDTLPTTPLEPLLTAWKTHDLLLNQTITIEAGAEQHTGQCRGISHNGEILIEHAGIVRPFSTGSLRWDLF